MNVIVYGAGAIGSVYAAKLADHHDVTVVARPAHVAAIARSGLRLVGQEDRTARVRAVVGLDRVAPDTLVLVTTKVNDNRVVAGALAPLVQPDTVVLCVQNGLHGERIVREALGDRCLVLRAITQFGAIFREPGVADLKVIGYTLLERHARSAAIAQMLTNSGLDGRVSTDIDVDVWRKLIFNCVINPITAMNGLLVGEIADSRLDRLKQLVIDECVAVAGAEGVVFDVDFQQALRDQFGNGAVVKLGHRHGIACPVNAALVAIIKAMEQ